MENTADTILKALQNRVAQCETKPHNRLIISTLHMLLNEVVILNEYDDTNERRMRNANRAMARQIELETRRTLD